MSKSWWQVTRTLPEFDKGEKPFYRCLDGGGTRPTACDAILIEPTMNAQSPIFHDYSSWVVGFTYSIISIKILQLQIK